ncbi:MAG TPA: DUF4350 domain-containing protein [Terriglobales bacterium]|jgi:hypothetical protein|nr:DUF4350 domain-containing protein [Terriglobales bacterium]
MPLKLDRGDRKIILISGGLFLLIITISFIFARGAGPDDDVPSTYSTGSGGAKAAYLLLKDSGYNVQRWEDSLSDLPDPVGKTLVLAAPQGSPTSDERRKLTEFVEKGGRIVATGVFAGFFLPASGAVPDPFEGATWKKMSARSPSAITRSTPEITMAPEAEWNSSTFAIPLYGDGEKQRVVKYKIGKGEVIWWASATPLTNAGLKELGNLEFFFACMGEPKDRQILWDEYFHGYRRSLIASAERTPLKWMFLQLALFTLAVLITYSRRSGPISIPPVEARLSPLEFVRTLGALYEQADAAPVAVDVSYHRFRYWLTRRLGMAGNASIEEMERAVRERWDFKDPHFAETLRACESVLYQSDLKPGIALKLVQSLDDFAAKLKLFRITGKEKN